MGRARVNTEDAIGTVRVQVSLATAEGYARGNISRGVTFKDTTVSEVVEKILRLKQATSDGRS